MSTALPEDDEMLAAEYALGSQSAAERAAVALRLPSDAALRGAVEWWDRRLGALTEDIVPVEPPARVWTGILARLDGRGRGAVVRPGFWQRVETWRWATAAAGLAAALLLVTNLLILRPATMDPRFVAVLNDADAKPALLVNVAADGASFQVQPLAAAALSQTARGRSFELWVVTAPNTAPKSMGVVSPNATTQRAVPAALVGAMPASIAFAISLEPPGGSPTGSATGPILYSGAIVDRFK